MSPKEVLEFAKKNDAKQLDLRFTDIPSLQHHVSYPISELDESSFEEGFGMDGSSIRGWAAINESDMLLIPDPKTAFMDPFAEIPTVVMLGDVIDPITKQHYERDPRWIATKAELHLQNSGVGDTAYFGAEVRRVADTAVLQVQLGLGSDPTGIALVVLLGDRIDHVTQHDHRRDLGKRIHERGLRVGDQQHVAFVDG